ncbi:MAG: hypothetical protein U0790_09385 [Isosphaeraceae bacterium]
MAEEQAPVEGKEVVLIEPRDAWALRRVLIGQPLNGELEGMDQPWQGMAKHLLGLDLKVRMTTWDTMLMARHEREELVRTLANQNPNAPMPDPGDDDADPQAAIPMPDWPAPPAPAAFVGISGEIVNVIEPSTEADPVALLLQLIVGFGSAFGRGAWLEADGQCRHENEFACAVGDTSRARKGTSWRRVRSVLGQAELAWASNKITGGLSSGEGLIWEIRDQITGEDKKFGQPVVLDPGVDNKRVLCIETEFGNVLR